MHNLKWITLKKMFFTYMCANFNYNFKRIKNFNKCSILFLKKRKKWTDGMECNVQDSHKFIIKNYGKLQKKMAYKLKHVCYFQGILMLPRQSRSFLQFLQNIIFTHLTIHTHTHTHEQIAIIKCHRNQAICSLQDKCKMCISDSECRTGLKRLIHNTLL